MKAHAPECVGVILDRHLNTVLFKNFIKVMYDTLVAFLNMLRFIQAEGMADIQRVEVSGKNV